MLLTLKQPQPSNHGFKSFHDYSPPTPPSTSRFSPALISQGPPYPLNFPAGSTHTTEPFMSTSHRGLPPPAAMTLPQPSQAPPPLSQPPPPLAQSLGQLPPPPQWQGAEESMRNWLHAKSEEDKRKQEEEKTQQETLRLEQRKVEQDMLRASLSGGIPPHLIPMVFAGMGGGNLPNASFEWAQHYVAQTQQLQQQQQAPQHQNPAGGPRPSSPALRREGRQISHSYASSQQHPVPAPIPSTPVGGPGSQGSIFVPGYSMSPGSRARGSLPGPAALARAPQPSQLPRLNTGEMQILQPPQAGPIQPGLPGHHPQQQHAEQDSPGLYFHHWQPPTSQALTSSSSHPTPSDSIASPKKRKAQGPQHAAAPPPPTSAPQYQSPPFSQTGSSMSGPSGTPARRRHSRRSSLEYGGRRGRHAHHESEGNISIQRGVSPELQQHGYAEGAARRNTLQMLHHREEQRPDLRGGLHMQHPQQQQQQHPQQLQLQHHQQQQPHSSSSDMRYSLASDLRRERSSPDRDRDAASAAARLHADKRDDMRD